MTLITVNVFVQKIRFSLSVTPSTEECSEDTEELGSGFSPHKLPQQHME